MSDQPEESQFAKRGISIITTKIKLEITEEDMLKDLVEKTEGENIPIEKQPDN